MRSLHPQRARTRRRSGLAMGIALSSTLLIASGAISACATSEDRLEPDLPEASSVVPSTDAGDEALLDADATVDDACAPGDLCRASALLPLTSITAMSGRSGNDIWASGSGGLLLNWNGQRWNEVDSPIHETLTALFLTPDELWGVAGKLALRRGLDPDTIQTARLYDLATFFEGIVVLPGQGAYVGVQSGWSYFGRMDFESGNFTPELEAIHPLTNEPNYYVLPRALFLVPERALWLVGEHATVARYPVSAAPEGSRLGQGILVPVASQADLLAAWGHDDDLWACGIEGTILHYDGAEWHIENTGTKVTFRAIFGFSSDDVWAAGDDGTVLHFDGSVWSPVGAGSYRGSLKAIWGATPDDVWFGGDTGIFHWGSRP